MKKEKLFKVLLSGALVGQTALVGVGPITVAAAEDKNTITHDQLTDVDMAAPKKDKVIPSPYQYKYQKDELSAFCHFGPNTFNEIEWGEHYGDKSPNEIFKLTQDFDAETLVKTLKESGFTKLIVTAKHHDGFCIWASNATEYDVAAATNYKNGQGDILAEISAACSKYDLDMGLYLSPWDIHDDSYGYKDKDGKPLVREVTENGQKVNKPIEGYDWDRVKAEDAKDYNKFYDDQLIEILGNEKYGNKGHFTEVWMDGAKGSGANYQEYDFQRWFDTIQKYEGKEAGQPDDCLLFGAEAHTTVRWIGNEHGFAANETWSKSKVDKEKNTIDSNSRNGYTQGFVDGNQWTVPEADARITSGWFWGNSKKTPKSMEALSEMYFRSVGHNAPLLLNIPPNNEGKVDVAILNRVKEFGNNINTSFKDNLAKDATVYANEVRGNDVTYSPNNVLDSKDKTYWTVGDNQTTGSITLKLPKTTRFDVVSIEEAIEFGQRIGKYKVEYRKANGDWKLFEEGTTIGAKRLCRKKPVVADEVKITVTAHEKADVKVPMLSEVGLYKVTADMALKSGIPEGLKIIDDRKFTQTGWNQESGEQFLENTGMWTSTLNKDATVKFTGTKAYLIGTIDPNHGTADVYIDGKKVKSINTNATTRKLGQVIFESDDLENKEHTLRIVNTGTGRQNAIGVDGLAYLDNGGKGALQIEYPSYRVNEDSEVPITIKRVGGTTGKVAVKFQVNPGSAWQDHFDANGNMDIVFEDGQKEAKAKIKTNRVPAKTGDLSFSMELVEPTGGAIVGFNSPVNVTIADTEEFTKESLKVKIDAVENANYDPDNYTAASYKALSVAFAEAKRVYALPNATNQDCAKAATALDEAVAALTRRSTFTAEDPFVLPHRVNDKKVLEAEYAILDSSEAKDKENKYVRIVTDSAASNGAKIGWFEEGNKVKVPFEAAKVGTYTFKVTYQSGRPQDNPNAINLTSTNIKEAISVNVHNKDGDTNGTTFQTTEFDVEITKAGKGELVFTADSKGSPNIDKIEITAKQVAMDNFTINAQASEHGTISPNVQTTVVEGQSQKYTFTPDEGYTVKEVYVDGKAIGARLDYTFTDVSSNHTIKVEFVKAKLAEDNRFVFPARGQSAVLEAERLQLHNTGTNETYPLVVTEGNWASMGKFVNAMNSGDTMTLYYDAPEAGTYDVTVTYRSGSDQNSLSWSEKDGKIANGSETIGASDSTKTRTKQFKVEVKQAGLGVVTFSTGDKGAPQMDRFVITNNNQEVLNVDVLGKTVADSEAVKLEEYKDGVEKETFKTALLKAKEVLEAAKTGKVTQAQIDEANKTLVDARAALVLNDQKPNVSIEKLQIAYEKAQAVTEEHLNKVAEAVKKEFLAAKKLVKSVLDKEKPTQVEINNAFDRLSKVMHMLEFIKGDVTELQKLVDDCSKLNEAEYTKDSYEKLKAAIEAAKEVIKDGENALAINVESAKTKLEEAKNNLQKIEQTVNKSALQAFYDKVVGTDESKYIPSSWTAFKEALVSATNVLKDNNVTQGDVDKAYEALVKAYLDLRLIPDKSALEGLINLVNSLKANSYTQESWSKVGNMLEKAKFVLDDPEATQQQVDDAYIQLQSAVNNLNAKDSGAVKTGDNNVPGSMFALASLSILGILANKKRKNK